LEVGLPVYEYLCIECKKHFNQYLTYSEYGHKSVKCPYCQGQQVQRRIGRIRVARSEESRLDSISDIDNLNGIEDNPRELGKMMRRMGSEAGEELGPEFDEVVNRLEKGQSAEEIEKELPDLGAGSAVPPPNGDDL